MNHEFFVLKYERIWENMCSKDKKSEETLKNMKPFI